MKKILIIEDEVDIADLIEFNLVRAEFEVKQAHDGISGTEMAQQWRPDFIILDWMLPGRDGHGVFRELRRDARTIAIPVLMLTAKGQVEDRVQGLELGVDDYLTKPFSPKELILRVRAILKRSESSVNGLDVELGPFRFDKNALKFYLEGNPVELTITEFKLLIYLCERRGNVVDRVELFRSVWGYHDDVYSRTLDTHVKRLRQKLAPHGDLVQTVRGSGYGVF